MPELGLKLWSTNIDFIPLARRLYDLGVYTYIELYAVPDTFMDHARVWNDVSIPFLIHAPHSGHGVNLAQSDYAEANAMLIGEAQRYADELEAERIIVHPGVEGDIRETVRQILVLRDTRFVIENKPYYSVYDHSICNGYSPQDIRLIMDETGAEFCLDIGHAIFAANALNVDRLAWVSSFVTMKPAMYHVSDGDYDGVEDRHLSLGRGNFPLRELIGLMAVDAAVTLETEKDVDLHLFQNDIRFLKAAWGMI
jgi:deoxyribonuclease-4